MRNTSSGSARGGDPQPQSRWISLRKRGQRERRIRFFFGGHDVPEKDTERFQLAIPVSEAFAFAMGWSDLDYVDPPDASRRVMGAFAIDALQYSEQWRTAALALACLEERWPGFFSRHTA